MSANANQSPMNIFLAVDGSEHSMAAIQFVCDLPIHQQESPQSTVTALAVDDLRHTHSHHVLTAILDKTQEILAEKNIRAFTGLLHGDPASELTRYAVEHAPDMIVLGARGLRATLGILLGGVAQQVVEYACCPVLVVRAPYQGLRRAILVSDGSPHSQNATQYLTRFPWPAGIDLRVVHVLPPPPRLLAQERYWPILAETIPTVTDDETMLEEWRVEQEKSGKAILQRTVADLSASGLQVTGVLLHGDAATEIIRYIEENQIDLFVAGSRGLSQMQAWLLGSVSRKLIHYANCSGLIVKEHLAKLPQ